MQATTLALFIIVSEAEFHCCYMFYVVFPKIIQDLPPTLQRGLAGHSYNMSCTAFGYPMPNFSWFHNQVELQSAMISVNVDNSGDLPITTSTLYFAQLDLSNEGVYYCNASNSLAIFAWDASSSGFLEIDCESHLTGA